MACFALAPVALVGQSRLHGAGVAVGLTSDVELACPTCAPGIALVLVEQGRVAPQAWRALALAQVAEELGEAGDEVALGDDEVHRQHHAAAGSSPRRRGRAASCPSPRAAASLASMMSVHGDRHQQAVERLVPRGTCLSMSRNANHSCLIFGLLGGVAAGGVEQDRLVGEPPVAVSGAADAADRPCRRRGTPARSA